MTSLSPTARFVRRFGSIATAHDPHARFSDFLELATCAFRKTTLPPGQEADAIEARYMAVVGRHAPDDIRAMPKLLAILHEAVAGGGCDALGTIAGELGLLDAKRGQFFTPYHVSRLIAEMALEDADAVIAERGFITLDEPASGAGGMVIAAADVIERQGLPLNSLYVQATDLSPLAFRMTYLQLALRGVPALVRRANSLSLEMFEQAHTPAMLGFLALHGAAFDRWRAEAAEQPRPARLGEQLLLL